MLSDFKQYANSNPVAEDPTNLPLPRIPRLYTTQEMTRLEFAGMFDGLMEYIKTESGTLFNEHLAKQIWDWTEASMPLSFEDMSKLYSKIDMQLPAIKMLFSRMENIHRAYLTFKTDIHPDNKIPTTVKLISRMNLMAAITAMVVRMSAEMYKIREGITN